MLSKFGNGVSWRATPDSTNLRKLGIFSQGYPLNIKKANKLLTDAGYKKRDGSKWRTDPNGKKLTIYFGND